MTTKEIITIVAVVLLIPIGLYLREQTYRGVHRNSTVVGDIQNLIRRFKEWRFRRKIRQQNKHLNKRK